MRMNNKIKDVSVERLRDNQYPGRGIIIGQTEDGRNCVQVYWIMGRSPNSRNRIFESEGCFVKTKAHDESKVQDPSLIIYYPVKDMKGIHIVSNGDQTETIFNQISLNGSLEDALRTRTFEPDPPHFTPRISGIIDVRTKQPCYSLSILKALGNGSRGCCRQFYEYDSFVKGSGHCIHTYMGDGNPLPSFQGEPYGVPVFNRMEENVEFYWNLLNADNRISLVVKFIEVDSGKIQLKIINKNK